MTKIKIVYAYSLLTIDGKINFKHYCCEMFIYKNRNFFSWFLREPPKSQLKIVTDWRSENFGIMPIQHHFIQERWKRKINKLNSHN